MAYNLNNPPRAWIVQRKDGSDVHTGYQGASPKIYTQKGHATAAAKRLVSRRYYDYTSRKWVESTTENSNPWIVTEAKIVSTPDPLRNAIQDYVEKSSHTGVAASQAVEDILNIIKTHTK